MKTSKELKRENRALRERLTRLGEASLSLNESLEFDSVLQRVADSARALTGSRYGALTVSCDAGAVPHFFVSGITPEEHEALWNWPDAPRYFDYLTSLARPLRVADIGRALGIPEVRLPVGVTSLLVAPISHLGMVSGTICVSKGEEGVEFTDEDEDTLVMFASQAALVIANAHRHRDEQQARSRLETLINTSPVGIVVLDAQNAEPASFNQEATRILGGLLTQGHSPEQLLETLTFRRTDGREFSLGKFPLRQALSESEIIHTEEMVIKVPDGGSVTTLVNSIPIHSEEGELESVVVTLQDMTPLEDMERLRAEFLGMVSHELRTPLTSIKGSAATLLESLPSLDLAEAVQLLRIIEGQANSMRDLINDLLDVAHIETGALSVSPEPAVLADLVNRAKNTFLSADGSSNVRIELPPDLPLVKVDRRRIIQVMNNVLANAARHSPPSSLIRVTALRQGGNVAVSVTDQGRGISADRMPHLFRKFSRLETEDQGGGTGLGLAICKGIVEAHGGHIWAESEGAGLGTRFTFTLPAVEEVETGAVVKKDDFSHYLF